MKQLRIVIIIAVSFICRTSVAQENVQLQLINTNCDTVTLQVWTWFPIGFDNVCPQLSGATSTGFNDTLTVLLYYDISGVWPQAGCETTDLVSFYNLPSNLTVLRGITHSINSGDTSAAVSEATIPLCSTGISEPGTTGISVTIFPNPSAGIFTIESAELPDLSFKVFNLEGEEISLKQDEHNIDLSAFPKGIYFVRIINGTSILNRKIVVR